MSTITVDALKGKTTAKTITVTVGATATQSLEQAMCSAHNAYDLNTDTQRDSLNVSTTTDRDTGSTYANLTNAMATATYNTVSSSSPVAIGSMGINNFNRAAISSPDTASRISHNSFTTTGSGSIQNDPYTAVVAHGGLA